MPYIPQLPPAQGKNTTPDTLLEYLYNELQVISNVVNAGRFQAIRLDVLQFEPPRPAEGDIAHFADNVVNPQGGLYSYENGSWHKL